MHARVGILEISGRAVEQSAKIMETQVLPSLRLMEGFRGALLLGEREGGRALYLTLWDTEDAMRRSEDDAAILREDSADALGADAGPVERYEVLVAELPPAEAG